ncbi:MAG: hypothetical protein WAP35_08665 [Solirubrobacterales bacterium]
MPSAPSQFISDTTIRLLSEPFRGGAGPSRAELELIWRTAESAAYFPDEFDQYTDERYNKLESVSYGLKWLRDGFQDGPCDEDIHPPQQDKLVRVLRELTSVLKVDLDDGSHLSRSLKADGFVNDEFGFLVPKSDATPAGKLSDYVRDILDADPKFAVAAEHYRQAQAAHERGDWAAANSQYRSTFDAALDALAHGLGCPKSKTGGDARQWLTNNDHLDKYESNLFKSFAAFAGEKGSHAGISTPAECQVRRHMVAALLTYAVKRFDGDAPA